MPKQLEITINDDGSFQIEGIGLSPNERVTDLAKFLTDKLGDVTEKGHKHTHKEVEITQIKA